MRAWEKLDGAPVETKPPAAPIAAAADACAGWYDDASNAAASTPSSSSFRATLRPDLVLRRDDVLARCVGADGAETLVDARPKPRWAGEAPEPRAGIRSGRVPGSACVPFFDVLDADDRTFKSRTRFATSSPPRART